jgi:hypothetical protein
MHWSTNNTLEDRQYIGGQTIPWRTDNTLPMYCMSSNVSSVLFNVLSVLQCIVCPPMYCLSSTMYCLSSNVLSILYNVLSVLQCILCPNTLEDRQYIEEDRQYIGGQTIHWRTDNTLEDRQYIGGQTIHWRTDNTL